MTTGIPTKRTDTASRVILASPRTLYRAFLDRETLASWRAPEGMRAEILDFDPRAGGSYRMELYYLDTAHPVPGKSGDNVDRVIAEFAELVPEEMIVEQVRFDSEDPAFAEPMTITTTFKPVRDGTKVTFLCENVPASISPEDHQKGLASSLRNLAMLTE